jgi:hypothetical protein
VDNFSSFIFNGEYFIEYILLYIILSFSITKVIVSKLLEVYFLVPLLFIIVVKIYEIILGEKVCIL